MDFLFNSYSFKTKVYYSKKDMYLIKLKIATLTKPDVYIYNTLIYKINQLQIKWHQQCTFNINYTPRVMSFNKWQLQTTFSALH